MRKWTRQKRMGRKNSGVGRTPGRRIGVPTGLLAADGTEIRTGDYVRLRGTTYDGPVLYHEDSERFGIFIGLWYGEDPYNPNSYGKFVDIPPDNGRRMELLRISQREAVYDACQLSRQTCTLPNG